MASIMARKRHSAEEIVNKLRQAEVELGKGSSVAAVCKLLGVTEQTCYRWRKEYGGLKADQAKKLEELEKENARLKRLLADAELDKAMLREVTSLTRSQRRNACRSGHIRNNRQNHNLVILPATCVLSVHYHLVSCVLIRVSLA